MGFKMVGFESTDYKEGISRTLLETHLRIEFQSNLWKHYNTLKRFCLSEA